MTPKDPHKLPKDAANVVKGQPGVSPEAAEKSEVEDVVLVVDDPLVKAAPPGGILPIMSRDVDDADWVLRRG